MSTAGKVILAVVAVGTVGVIAYLVLKPGAGRPPATAAVSGPAAGQAPVIPRSNNAVTNTINDLLSFTKQGVDIYSSWNKSKSMA